MLDDSDQRQRELIKWSSITLGTVLFVLIGLPWLAATVGANMPLSWEQGIGDFIYDPVKRSAERCQGELGQQVLTRLGAKLRVAAQLPYELTVDVLNEATLNAVSLPGGHIVVFRGLLEVARDANEVVGVLAHEVGHITQRHGMQSMARQLSTGLLFAAVGGDPLGLTAASATLGNRLLSHAYSRQQEFKADRIGVELLDKLGLDSRGITFFFDNLRSMGLERHSGVGSFLATHPGTTERFEALRDVVKKGPLALSDAEWHLLRQICEAAPA